jgi:hypothetical protein
MEVLRIHGTFSNDAIAFFKNTSDALGEKIEPDVPEPSDIFAVARKAQLAMAPRVAIDPAFCKVPDMDNDVDSDDDGDPIPMMFKITAIDPAPLASALSDWKADFLKRTGCNEPTTTLGKKLGVVRQTIREMDGERQLRGFNVAGELVDFRILLPNTE